MPGLTERRSKEPGAASRSVGQGGFRRMKAIELHRERKSWPEIARACGVGITTVRRACKDAAQPCQNPQEAIL